MNRAKSLRNYLLLMLDGGFWQGYITCLDPASVLPLFILAMTGSKMLTGLPITIMSAAPIVGVLTLGRFTPRIRNLVAYTAALRLMRTLLIFLMSVPLFLNAPPLFSTRVFFMLFTLLNYLDGAMEVPMGELKSRVLTREMRGHMTGIALLLGGVLSVIAGWVINALFASDFGESRQYAFIFLLASACAFSGFLMSLFVREYAPAPQIPRRSFKDFYRGAFAPLWGDRTLRTYFYTLIPCFFSQVVVNFTVSFGKSSGLFSEAVQPQLLMARIVGILVGGLIWGEVSRRRGNRAVILWWHSLCALVALSSLTAIVIPGIPDPWIVIVCFVCGIAATGWIGRTNYLLDIAPEEKRSEYQVLLSFIGIPFIGVGILAGAVIEYLGYAALFAGCAVTAVVTVIFALKLKRPSEMG
jgi:MFS family permease